MGRQLRLYNLCDIPTPYGVGVQRYIVPQWPGDYKIAYCASAEPGREWTFNFEGLNVEILNGYQFRPKRQVNPISIKWNPSVWKSLNTFRPDVVVLSGYFHPTMYLAALWCRLRAVPYGITCETSCRNTTSRGAKWLIKRLVAGWIVRNMAFGLPVGREAANYLRLMGARRSPLFSFPNTPDTSLVIRQATQAKIPDNEERIRNEFGIPAASKIVLYVGRLIEAKRPIDLALAFRDIAARSQDAVLVFVGDGPLLPEIRRLANGQERIICAGWISDPLKVAALMAIASVFVLPSQHETWGAVINEAMAAGLPVVASNAVGAAIEMIQSGLNGIIYDVGDKDMLARAVTEMLCNPSRGEAIGCAARQTAVQYGPSFAADNFLKAALGAIATNKETELPVS